MRVRAWVDRGVITQADTASVYTVETAYRVFVDPSREARETEQPVGDLHPARVKIVKLLERLTKEHGGGGPAPADSTLRQPAPPPPPSPHGG